MIARLVSLHDLLFGAVIAGVGLLIVSAITVRTQRRYRRVHRVLHAGDALPGGRANLAMTGMLLLAGIGAWRTRCCETLTGGLRQPSRAT